MGKCTRQVTLLLEFFTDDGKNLHDSFVLSDSNVNTCVISDDGFLPDNVNSIYGYFLGEFDIGSKPKYFNQIDIPKFWQISSSNVSGEIHDMNKLKARIFYAKPFHKRLVKEVDYYDEKGKVRYSDHYNKYGALYARGVYDKDGKMITKSFFDSKGQEVIVENLITKDIILNKNNTVKVFENKVEFVKYYLEESNQINNRLFINSLGLPFFVSQSLYGNVKDDVLFWQEPRRSDIPGNMQFILSGKANRVSGIYVQNNNAYNGFVEAGVPEEQIEKLGFVYDFVRNSKRRLNALICTNSDQIPNLEEIVKRLSHIDFHILAITEMSANLLSVGKYTNVNLYPAAKVNVIDKLFEKCDIYLDVNKQNEILSAVHRAFLNNQIIYSYKETCHNYNYVDETNIYESSDYLKMCESINKITSNKSIWDDKLEKQRKFALSENIEKYKIF